MPMRYAAHIRVPRPGEATPADDAPPIGALMRDALGLSDEQIDRIIMYQRKRGIRFGEAAVALRLAERADVLEALSRQYDFPYTRAIAAHAHNSELVMAANPFGGQADAFRELRSRLLMEVLAEEPRPALAVLSPDVGDGKTYVAANLAAAFSQLRGRTLLIDADMRAPRQHSLLGVDNNGGLSSVLSGRSRNDVVQPVPHLPSLNLLAAGPLPPNPLELLQGPAFDRLMDEMLQSFDHVVVDTPAGMRGADARVIAAKSGAALVIGRKGRTRLEALQGLLDSLAKGPAQVAGVLMNAH